MRIGDLITGAFGALRMNKLRSGLTTLGIVIGVGAVVAMMAMTSGFEEYVNEQFSGLGSNTFQIQKWPAMRMGGSRHMTKYRKRKDITVANSDAVRERDEAARFVGAELWAWGGLVRSRYGTTPPNVVVAGGTPEFVSNNGYDFASGRNMNATDIQHERNVVILGADIATALFPHSSGVNQHVVFSGKRFQVIGVMAAKGSFFGMGSRDNFVVVPITSFIRIYGKNRSVNITVQALGPELFDKAKDRAIQIMRQERRLKPGQENDFDTFSNESVIDTVSGITKYITLAAIGIAILSLVVGGIGIMNIMMVSVTERTREIGVRRALGARKSNILWQFTVEAVILSALGGLIGLGIGYSAAYLVKALAGLPASVPPWSVAVALGMSSLVGLVFGIYPAWRASRLDPIVALRYE
jgi:putative ABC transport system permease protein